jgi:hypothetical protein
VQRIAVFVEIARDGDVEIGGVGAHFDLQFDLQLAVAEIDTVAGLALRSATPPG